MRRLRRRCFLRVVVAFAALFFHTESASPDTLPPPDPPDLKTLAASVVAAPDDAVRDRLIAGAPAVLQGHPQLGHALNTAWEPIIFTGDYGRAWQLGEYTRRLLLRRGDVVDAAYAWFLLGFIDGSRGDNQAALEKFTAAQRVFEAAADQDKIARVLAGEGKVHLQLGEFRQALAETRRALEIYRAIDNKDGIINTLNGSGSIFMAQGLTDRAMDYRQQALAVAGDDAAWHVYLFHNFANVYARRGEWDRAIDWMSRSIAAATKVGDRSNIAAGLQELGGFHLQKGQLAAAEDEFRQALRIGEELGEKRRQTATLSGLGELLRRKGDEKSWREALAFAERAVLLAGETGEPAYLWNSYTLKGKLLLALHEPEQARKSFEESIAAIEDARGHVAAGDTGAAAFLEDKMAAYHGMVALLVQENQPAAALAVAERAKARVLVDLLHGPKLDPTQAMTDAERASVRQHSSEIAALNRQIATARTSRPPTPPEVLAGLDEKLAAARRARDDAEEDFFIAHPELRSHRPPHDDAGLSNRGLNALLANGRTALLEYLVTSDETFLFTVTKAKGNVPDAPPIIRAQRLPLNRAALSARTEEFRNTLAERGLDWQTGARALGEDLLGPAWEACAHCDGLVIVADGPLWELPFQVLAAGGMATPSSPLRTLWEACSVSYAPSLTFLTQTPAAPPAHPPCLLAVGNPALAKASAAGKEARFGSVVTEDEVQPLPDSERQVRALTNLYGAERSKALVGAEAHEDVFKRLAGDYDVIHLATHGYLNDTAPMYSHLLLAQTNLAPDEDGLLEAWEWLPLHLHARLAVLSACESGRGRIGYGEGVIGLSWALFRAGCPAVVVSQWKVDNASTTDLMISFHQRLLAGDAPAEALRGAGLALAKEQKYRHPFYWAPFVLVGAGTRIAPACQ